MARLDLDAFGLMAERLRKLIYFGDVEVGPAASGGHFTTAISELSTGDVDLDLDLVGAQPVDFLSTLTITFEEGGYRQNMLTGAVLSVDLEGRVAHVKARAAPAMTELLMRGMVVQNATPSDVIHATARSAGFPEERLSIHGLERLPDELFEVVVPVSGIAVARPQQVGPAWLVPKDQGANALAGFNLEQDANELKSEFEAADSYLVATVDARLLYHAEERGLAAVDIALSWLGTRARYGLATLPNGRGQAFSRARALTAPARGTVVLIRGLLTRRRWIRRPGQLLHEQTWEADESSELFDPGLPADVPASDREALAALHRAITEVDQVSRTQSLWQAIEAYAGETRVPKLFDKRDRKRLEGLMPKDLTKAQKTRLTNAYRNLNRPPLMDRLLSCVDDDAVPISDGEIALLDRLRQLRNQVTHGQAPSWTPEREELEHAISIVSRMLVFRIARIRSPAA